MTALLSLVSGIQPRPNSAEYAVDPAAVKWADLKGKPVRIVFEQESQAVRDLLRAACANDCDVELLDVHMGDLVTVFYDRTPVRRAKQALGLPVDPHFFLHTPYLAWADLREYLKGKNRASD